VRLLEERVVGLRSWVERRKAKKTFYGLRVTFYVRSKSEIKVSGLGLRMKGEREEIKVSSFKFQVSSNNGVDEKIIVGAPSRRDSTLIAPRRRSYEKKVLLRVGW